MSGTLDDKIDQLLGLDGELITDVDQDGEYIEAKPPEEIPMEVLIIPSEFDGLEEQNDLVHDYVKSRNVLHTLLERSTTALEGAMRVAVESESPRGYEVVKQLIDASKDLSKDIINLHKQCKEIKKIEKTTPDGGGSKTPEGEGGSKFSGSTTDLMKFIEDLQNS